MSLYEYLKASASRARKINAENKETILHDNSSSLYLSSKLEEYGSFDLFPVSSYDDYKPHIREYLKGRDDALTCYPVSFNLLSSGSSGERSRFLLTEEALRRYSSYWYSLPFEIAGSMERKEFHVYANREPEGRLRETYLSAAFYWTQRKNGILNEKNMFGGFRFAFVNDVENILYAKARLLFSAPDLTAIIANYLYDLTVLFSYIEENADMIADDILKSRISVHLSQEMHENIRKLPVPGCRRIMKLKDYFKNPDGNIKELFPSLEFITGIGGSAYSRHTMLLSRFTGDIPVYYYTYAASECKMGVPIEFGKAEYLLIPDCAYYEFISADTGELIKLEDLETGMKVSPVVTTFSGLYRYRIKDTVVIQDFYEESPLMTVLGRSDEILNAGGEKLTLKVFQDCFDSLGLAPADYAVTVDFSSVPARYLVYTETADRKSADDISAMLDEKLRKTHEEYADICLFGLIGKPLVMKIPSGTLEKMRQIFFKGGHRKASVLLRSSEAEYLRRSLP